MRGQTHALFGVTTLVVAQRAVDFIQANPGHDIRIEMALCATAAIFGALAPDIDAEDSTIKRELGLVGTVTSLGLRLFGVQHRGLTHSGLTTALAMALAWLIGSRLDYADIGLAFGLGYLSHVLADAMTKHGVPLLWPLPGRFHLLPGPLRVRTGGPLEHLIVVAMAALLVWLLPAVILPEIS